MFIEELNFIPPGKLIHVQFIFVASRAAANRASLDESGTKIGRCHTVHALKWQSLQKRSTQLRDQIQFSLIFLSVKRV